MAEGVGRMIQDRYRVDRELGRHGAVVTWLVTDLRSTAPCVLKVLREADAPPADARLFEAQARVLAGLEHPGLPRFVEYFVAGEGAGREHVLVTRYHPGESLDRLVAKGRLLTEAQAMALLRRLVPVLAYLHGLDPPLMYRGLKPANVIVGPDGRPYLTDLHFALEGEGWKAWEETPPEAADARLAAPEVALGGAVPASDICSLGLALLYAMSGQDPAAIVREGGRQRIREAARCGDAFAGILARMVEPSLERRYPDVRALEADLARLVTGRGPAAPPAAVQQPAAVALPKPLPSGPGEAPARRVLPWVAMVLLVLAAGAAYFWLGAAQRGGTTGESLVLSGGPGVPTQRTVPPEAATPPSPAERTPPPEVAAVPAVPAETTPPPAPAVPSAAEPSPGATVAAVPQPAPPVPEEAPGPVKNPEATPAATAPAAPAAGADPAVVEGRLLFDGQPITSVTRLEPSFWFRDQAKGTPVKPQIEYKDGAFRVRGLPQGRMGIGMRINLEPGNPSLYPGDLDAWTNVVIGAAPLAPLEIDMRKVIRLKQPVDNGAVIAGWGEPCGTGSVHPGRILFAWEPLDPAAQYEVGIDRLACGRGYASAGRAFATKTGEPWVKVELPPSAAGECYSFRVSARKGGRPIGTFTTHGSGGLGFDYRFVVK